MTIVSSDIEKIARLARIRVDVDEVPAVVERLNNILTMVDRLQAVDTAGVEPMANPLDATQRLRVDTVTEPDQRAALLAIAPASEAGLFLVPKVIE